MQSKSTFFALAALAALELSTAFSPSMGLGQRPTGRLGLRQQSRPAVCGLSMQKAKNAAEALAQLKAKQVRENARDVHVKTCKVAKFSSHLLGQDSFSRGCSFAALGM